MTNAGKNAVTSYSQSHGYNFTSMGRLLLESTINGDNYTSVGDCAKFMAAVYNGELPHSNEMLNLLKQQQRTSKIPAGVPYGVQTANKTGELPQVQNDAAIVFADQPVILITYPDLGRCCLQDCRLSTMSVEYGIVVAVILDVVVVRDFQDCFIIADHIASAWQWFHTWSVVFLKCILPGILFLLKRS